MLGYKCHCTYSASAFLKRFYVRRFANNTNATMRIMIYNNIMSKSINELNDENRGNLMTRVIPDVDLSVARAFTI